MSRELVAARRAHLLCIPVGMSRQRVSAAGWMTPPPEPFSGLGQSRAEEGGAPRPLRHREGRPSLNLKYPLPCRLSLLAVARCSGGCGAAPTQVAEVIGRGAPQPDEYEPSTSSDAIVSLVGTVLAVALVFVRLLRQGGGLDWIGPWYSVLRRSAPTHAHSTSGPVSPARLVAASGYGRAAGEVSEGRSRSWQDREDTLRTSGRLGG